MTGQIEIIEISTVITALPQSLPRSRNGQYEVVSMLKCFKGKKYLLTLKNDTS